jgi:retinol dehydrogenase-14
MPVLKPFMKAPAKGAETPIYLASSAEVEGVSGAYFVNCTPTASSRASHDAAAEARLWRVSEQLSG